MPPPPPLNKGVSQNIKIIFSKHQIIILLEHIIIIIIIYRILIIMDISKLIIDRLWHPPRITGILFMLEINHLLLKLLIILKNHLGHPLLHLNYHILHIYYKINILSILIIIIITIIIIIRLDTCEYISVKMYMYILNVDSHCYIKFVIYKKNVILYVT